jgi:5-(carboxyamino)imidazole ribonucleotide synthase
VTSIPPGATIGILGGGQLGRMTALAAARLGYRCHVLAPEADSPAADVAAEFTCAAYGDSRTLRAFADQVDVVTLEFENVPLVALELVAEHRPVRPSARVLRVTQDRLAEKDFLVHEACPVTRYAHIASAGDLARAFAELGAGMLKTTRLGYDGKGQIPITAASDLAGAVAALGQSSLIYEALVDFVLELSVITARTPQGCVASYPPVENRHRDGILRTTVAPAELPSGVADRAVALAERIAVALGLEGLLAVELFLTRDGRLLVNELAPRPHNSGHWTIDACAVSQFEQLVRAVCSLPLGDPSALGRAEMTNLIGADVQHWRDLLAEPGARVHLYGKREARPGRKMGHVTRVRR